MGGSRYFFLELLNLFYALPYAHYALDFCMSSEKDLN